jgi:hypothetical protein
MRAYFRDFAHVHCLQEDADSWLPDRMNGRRIARDSELTADGGAGLRGFSV